MLWKFTLKVCGENPLFMSFNDFILEKYISTICWHVLETHRKLKQSRIVRHGRILDTSISSQYKSKMWTFLFIVLLICQICQCNKKNEKNLIFREFCDRSFDRSVLPAWFLFSHSLSFWVKSRLVTVKFTFKFAPAIWQDQEWRMYLGSEQTTSSPKENLTLE